MLGRKVDESGRGGYVGEEKCFPFCNFLGSSGRTSMIELEVGAGQGRVG